MFFGVKKVIFPGFVGVIFNEKDVRDVVYKYVFFVKNHPIPCRSYPLNVWTILRIKCMGKIT